MSALVVPQRQALIIPFPSRPRIYRVRLDLEKLLGAMMAIFVPDASSVTNLKRTVNALAGSDPVMCLYVNNITPASTDTLATYTEMTTQGYVSKSLPGASWTFTSGNPSHADYAQQTWTFNGIGGATLVYGYYVRDSQGTPLLLWPERFSDGPYTIQNNGDQILISPYWGGQRY